MITATDRKTHNGNTKVGSFEMKEIANSYAGVLVEYQM